MAGRGPYIVYNKAVEAYSFGPAHPFRLDRGRMFLESIRFHRLVEDGQLVAVSGGTDSDLRTFHTPEYLRILTEAGEGEHEDDRRDGDHRLHDVPQAEEPQKAPDDDNDCQYDEDAPVVVQLRDGLGAEAQEELGGLETGLR